ncbi:uncharacterized protein PAC_03799 [Phialocephala subalpina]|uniref:Alpha/beta hydrolase fold-3 domain-containing protein n=1 Tax=Phialocephala subalpina TaxID=576137 RepID=A0A1L7WMD3_9HELO|nr:uncharacterized protein PAC_03799 [Phialocephala subalpina]
MASKFHLSYDPELDEAFASFPPSHLTKESLMEVRNQLEPLYTAEKVITDPEISHKDITIPGPNGDVILAVLKWKKSKGGPRPAIYYMHGGGMITGNRFTIGGGIEWIKELDAVLKWVSEHASKVEVNPDRILITGSSGGGNVCAGLALLARDKGGPKIRAQCLCYPMIDDRMETTSVKHFYDQGTWKGQINEQAWDYLLDGKRGAEDIDVGQADMFRDENVAYAMKL